MDLVLVMTIPYPQTHNYGSIILAPSNMFQLEDSHEASTKNFLQVRKMHIPNAHTKCTYQILSFGAQTFVCHIFWIVPITLLLETSLTLILSPVLLITTINLPTINSSLHISRILSKCFQYVNFYTSTNVAIKFNCKIIKLMVVSETIIRCRLLELWTYVVIE